MVHRFTHLNGKKPNEIIKERKDSDSSFSRELENYLARRESKTKEVGKGGGMQILPRARNEGNAYDVEVRKIMEHKLSEICKQQERKQFKVYYSPINPFEDCENNLSNVQHLIFKIDGPDLLIEQPTSTTK